ncbi:hypothetical protein GOP47_0008716 [Adiantum capillus-veneris]|uniref:Uncharacterized protein n=1 Tax=Adiantum capillus-veneris TaxID=13818 RepID=A0A9D4UYW4_ADICA|nr:hypothetical protein GOP47_0008716 [Adiantum capillus-veneris]
MNAVQSHEELAKLVNAITISFLKGTSVVKGKGRSPRIPTCLKNIDRDMALMGSRPLIWGVQQPSSSHDCLMSNPPVSASPLSRHNGTHYSTSSKERTLSMSGSEFVSSNSLKTILFSAPRRHQIRAFRLNVMADADYYSLLGVSKNASKTDIKSSYRKLARQYHPDVNKEPDAEDKFKALSNAYEVLSDDEKRAIYDQFGEAGLKGAGAGASGFSNPFDLFETFFGGMGGMGGMGGRSARSRPMQGADEQYDLRIGFIEAVFGTTKDIEVSRLETCETCDGSGAKPGTSPKSCSRCGGQGQVVSSARTPLGEFRQISTCPSCNGVGETSVPCTTCRGDGRERKKKNISLKVPAGVDSGSRLRVRSEGNSGKRGGPPGDLYVFISVQAHPSLSRDGSNILTTCRISYIDAILGITKKVPTVDGDTELKIPAGTQPGTTLVMSRKGVPVLGKPNLRGDQLVRVEVEIPKYLSSEEKKLIDQLADLKRVRPTANARA